MLTFKQWQNDQSPRHQLDPVVQSDPYSLADKSLPKITTTPESLDTAPFNQCIVLPLSLKWLLPKSIINLAHIGVISGTLANMHEWEASKPVPGMYDTEDNIMSSAEQFVVNYDLWKMQDTLIVLIDENEVKYPAIITNFMTRHLAQMLSGIKKITLLVNSDRLTELKRVHKLVPPEFISGSVTSLILALSPHQNLDILVIPSEGPTGFEKYNYGTVDALVDEMSKLLCSYPSQTKYYVSECMKLWKLHGCTNTQGGLYI